MMKRLMTGIKKSHWNLFFVLCSIFTVSAIILTACTVPKNMRVRSGMDPRYQDDDVRFRTTYYFRVFDQCDGSGGSGSKIIKDSLYRFRMTGKANSLSTKVHFESGTLHKSQIDPFGAAAVYDKDLGRFRYVSQKETKKTVVQNEKYKEIEKLKKLYKDMAGLKETTSNKSKGSTQNTENSSDPIGDKAVEALKAKIQERITAVIEELAVPSEFEETVERQSSTGTACSDGSRSKQGFQILGPEGWKTFDQDERLVMAMTTSGKPLLNVMNEISSRMLNAQPSTSESLLPLVEERLRLSRAERKLYKAQMEVNANTTTNIGEVLQKVIEVFKAEK